MSHNYGVPCGVTSDRALPKILSTGSKAERGYCPASRIFSEFTHLSTCCVGESFQKVLISRYSRVNVDVKSTDVPLLSLLSDMQLVNNWQTSYLTIRDVRVLWAPIESRKEDTIPSLSSVIDN